MDAMKHLSILTRTNRPWLLQCTESCITLMEGRDPWNLILCSAYFPNFFSGAMYQQFSAAPPDYGHEPLMGSLSAGPSTVSPQATTTTPSSHQKPPPLVATGDWAQELVQLARTAELKYVYRDPSRPRPYKGLLLD